MKLGILSLILNRNELKIDQGPTAQATTLEVDGKITGYLKPAQQRRQLPEGRENLQKEETACQLHINLGINIWIYKELQKLNTQSINELMN